MLVPHLAEINIARLKSPLESPEMSEFVDNLSRINALAEASPGFIWRLQDEAGNATGVEHVFGDDYIVNLSVWADLESLRLFTYKSAHAPFIRRRKDWFGEMTAPHLCLWYVDVGHLPTTAEAKERLNDFKANGPTPTAFTFSRAFTPTGDPLRKGQR